ncbi:MAG TPA: MauE/DoxX family redox-associated membrane protein [Pyrinomonadaceae bacterium]
MGTAARYDALVWLVSGAAKLTDLTHFHAQVGAYQLLPSALEAPFAYGLPFVEVALGGAWLGRADAFGGHRRSGHGSAVPRARVRRGRPRDVLRRAQVVVEVAHARPTGFRASALSRQKEQGLEARAPGVMVVGQDDGKRSFLGSIGVRFLIDGSQAGERFSLAEHPMSPRGLAAPLHLHTREDEYSFVLEGRMDALLGDDVAEAGPADLVFKPRQPMAHVLERGRRAVPNPEIISPAGFERFFRELVDLGGVGEADAEAFAKLRERYG